MKAWSVVAALFATGFMMDGGGLYSFILFTDPLANSRLASSTS